ncbi:PIN2/TERF1-interacting telomerase inhibitor 1 isoform X4 [Colius striatus]|uniref:PIN2/TERF1-interacting telomerase inhibitor 1 isoform X4 n=1 Tax=Colius striatus TaxID=57412 RepID=UPI002B1D24F7|nr:PIN2/TERF1-interacting telomerase inhibitor 1 isoform X4 [Colius striatus]
MSFPPPSLKGRGPRCSSRGRRDGRWRGPAVAGKGFVGLCGVPALGATSRRKQKWSVDPQNSAWSKDDSKFGQKMLEKMGWSKGKGLGAQEQGNTEHIKVQVKNNTLGLGATMNYEDNWIAHQDDFNQLLAELNNCHGQGETESLVETQKKTFNLEEKSKSSKKRVHYMKFAKGKDLSSRSEDDLSCIFGKRQKNMKTQVIDEDVEQDCLQNQSLWNSTDHRPPTRLCAIDHHSLGSVIQPALDPPHHPFIQATLPELSDEDVMGDSVKSLAEVKVDDICCSPPI